MASRPILFSGPMIRQIRADRKTQTRRVIRDDWWRCLDPDDDDDRAQALIMCPYGQPGDKLWVRETWYCDVPHDDPERAEHLYYRADGEARDQFEQLDPPNIRLWKPSIHMPRWASRLTLEVTAVRVERLQAITEEDAIAEGVDAVPVADVPRQGTLCRRDDFAQLWELINGKRAPWASNPWVWVVTFRRLP